ncbi:MAG: hypothetical protein JNL58_21975 [Planctomyces sp.]|nr:hypothetical protein [Planctomyces sp.]
MREVTTVEDVGPLPAAGTDLHHVQRLVNLGLTKTKTDDGQVPFITKLLTAADGKGTAHLLNLTVLCAGEWRCGIARTELGTC